MNTLVYMYVTELKTNFKYHNSVLSSRLYNYFDCLHNLYFVCYRWGRRVAFMSTLLLMVCVSIMTSFSRNYFVYTVLRTINGLSFPAIYQIPFILSKSIDLTVPYILTILKCTSCYQYKAVGCNVCST